LLQVGVAKQYGSQEDGASVRPQNAARWLPQNGLKAKKKDIKIWQAHCAHCGQFVRSPYFGDWRRDPRDGSSPPLSQKEIGNASKPFVK